VPTRPFGKTGIDVSILSLGGMFDIGSNQLMLRQALKWGVTYWDTAASYMGGKSETRIGRYFGKYPEARKRVFLVTKSHAWTLSGLTRDLDRSLERMKTDCIDLFFKHAVRDPDDLDDDLKAWAEKAKTDGKIRLFGFSTHSNMESCMLAAAKLDWIDGIMMEYNYRLMHSGRMKRAVAACADAGIGLTAMKTQGGGSIKTDTETELQMAGRFLAKGFTDAQAKLMAVWQNPAIACICSEMPNMTILMANVAAAMGKIKLGAGDLEMLHRLARETRSSYCAGCTDICEPVLERQVPIGDIMRYLKYCRSYGNRDRARAHFKELPPVTRKKLARLDYCEAERRCPQNMPIGRLMREAAIELS
jgi:predicted aldo/keto reductase-like oxidoreductase